MSAKARILDSARELYNSEGLKKVTARRICSELEISPGSFSYHFPDKKDIIQQLFLQMTEEISQIMIGMSTEKIAVTTYLETHRQKFHVQKRYRFFYLNLFEILQNYPDIKMVYIEQMKTEREMAKQMFALYVESGVIKPVDPSQVDRMIDVGQILNNFWTTDAELMNHGKNELTHYMQLCCGVLEPHLTNDSWHEYHQYFAELNE